MNDGLTNEKKEEYVNMKRKEGTEELTDKWRDCRRERERKNKSENIKAGLRIRMRTAL